jgi:diguanylate cyclase (GGDEF)-like protein
MFRLSAFRSRVERNIVAMVLVCGLLPLAWLAVTAMGEIEEQTLRLAENQLAQTTEAYGHDLLHQIEQAEAEVRLRYLSGSIADGAHSIGGFAIIEPANPPTRTLLALGQESLLMQVPQDGVVLIGTIAFEQLFAGLEDVSDGVERCVALNDQRVACQGTSSTDGTARISAAWEASMADRFDSDIQLKVTSVQLRDIALQPVSLIARLLPLAILLAALIIGWLLMIQIRRLMSPLAELKQATLAVTQGDYDYRVCVKTGDEFEKLAEDFNQMTARLGGSFKKMQGMGEIDRLILSAASVDRVVKHALQLADEGCGVSGCVFLFDASGDGRLFLLEDGGLAQRSLSLDLKHGTVEQAQLLLARHLDKVCVVGLPIRCNGELAGYLLALHDFAAQHSGLDSAQSSTLAELADRLSVAVTNSDRARALYRQANYDVLTGLINRQAFNDRLGEQVQVAARRGVQGALLFLDLDRFKQVNDTEGHLTGDEMLQEVARRLQEGLRTTDIVARLGGDEFAIIFPELKGQSELTVLCERLIDSVCRPFAGDTISHPVDVSIGVSMFPDDGTDPGVLLMKADVAMYKAKEHKGSAFAFFDESLNEATEKRVRIEARLRSVLAEERLELHFQPKVNLRSNRIEMVEGLIRWPQDEKDRLSPDQFIPVAEDTGLIQEFTRLLVEQSARCLRASDEQRLGLQRVAINMSSQQVVRPGFADSFLAELVRAELVANRMELELTESVFVEDAEAIVGELNKLRAAGVHVALDDFGTGYSSLNMLRSLPLDSIKIDRSFITPLTESQDARRLALKIVEIARLLRLEVVAEGVESEAELSVLRDIHCDLVQGFLFAPALSLEELTSYLIRYRESATSAVVELVRP